MTIDVKDAVRDMAGRAKKAAGDGKQTVTNFRASQHATCNKFFMSYQHYCALIGAVIAVELLQCAAVATCAGSVNDIV
ncbi:MAG: uncharacterized protein KVP18_000762 [Porospora cf. gigantea A]|uniref:uncharacterized protein n=1 Tax=Porospora cf. gigantea A TaxID=2853593 RepID=UPI0035599C3E|nr:MAG: hypothetical protein KVP18_000762 [Porospora cf. gigantea A]